MVYRRYTQYLSRGWNQKDDQLLRDIFLKNKASKLKFDKWNYKLPQLAGNSFFNFLVEKFGTDKLSDFFYLVRVSRDIKSSLYSITGITYDELCDEWFNYYHEKYKDLSTKNTLKSKTVIDNKFNINQFVYFKKNNSICYISDNNGFKEIFIKDSKNNRKRIFKYGYVNKEQISDGLNPMIFTNDKENILGIIYEKRNQIIYREINLKDLKYKEYIISPKYRKIYSVDYFDKNNLLLTADIDGVNDIFIYNYKKKQTDRITENIWDDRDAKLTYWNNQQGIVFSSNMQDTISGLAILDSLPPLGTSDIYFLNLENKKITNLTSTPDINESKPIISNDNLYFISNENGISNIKKISHSNENGFVTNSMNDINSYFISDDYIYFQNDNLCDYKIFKRDKSILDESILFNNKLNQNLKPDNKINSDFNSRKQFIEIDSGLLFQSKFKDSLNLEILKPQEHIEKPQLRPKNSITNTYSPFKSYKAVASRLKFSYSELVTKMDNEILFEGLETYDEANQAFQQPEAGVLVKTIVKDMFDDYFLEGGLRFSTDFNTKEYFIEFENLKHQIDWQYAFYRKSKSSYNFDRIIIIDKQKFITNLFQVQAKYSFDNFNSVKLISRLQSDKEILTASDTISLNQDNLTEQRISLKAEYVFDNTSVLTINQLEGNRSKFFIEVFNNFNLDFSSLSNTKLSNGMMFVLGFDARQYFKVLNKSTLAFRLAGQTSFGKEKIIYFLGGMENWYFSSESNLVPYPENDDYAYKVLVANMRGFGYNARNGNTFLVMNNEFRIPVFRYIFGNNLNKSFFRNFQLNLFCDIGLAWYGSSPFSDKNPSNYETVEVPPSIKLKIRYYSDPIIGGVGLGVRTTIFGYFVKFDYGWGIETSNFLEPKLYFSVGYDF
ncbi:MAG: hypothetical protein R2771_07975 [Saprospiraceae bacterium]